MSATTIGMGDAAVVDAPVAAKLIVVNDGTTAAATPAAATVAVAVGSTPLVQAADGEPAGDQPVAGAGTGGGHDGEHGDDGGSAAGGAEAEPYKESAPPPLEVIGGYPVHPVATLFPLMAGDEFEALVESIDKHGLRDPVVLQGGVLIEGRNRVLAVELLRARGRDIALTTVEWWPGPGDSTAQYIYDKNISRRHLTDAQRAQIAARVRPIIEAEFAAARAKTQIKPGEVRNPGGRNQHTGGSKADANSPPPSDQTARNKAKAERSTVGKVATKAKVTQHVAKRATKIQKHASPEDIAAVRAGTKHPREVEKAIDAKAGKAKAPATKPGKPKPKPIDHPFHPKDDFEHDTLRLWVKWVETTLGVADKPRARKVLREIFNAEEALEKKYSAKKGGSK
jgi:hypothetical protein